MLTTLPQACLDCALEAVAWLDICVYIYMCMSTHISHEVSYGASNEVSNEVSNGAPNGDPMKYLKERASRNACHFIFGVDAGVIFFKRNTATLKR